MNCTFSDLFFHGYNFTIFVFLQDFSSSAVSVIDARYEDARFDFRYDEFRKILVLVVWLIPKVYVSKF